MYQSPEVITRVAPIIRQRLTIEPEFLETQIIELDAIRFDLAEAVVDQLQLLHEKKKQMLWPKDIDKGLTELDRSVRLNGDVAVIERDYQFLIRLEALVHDKLGLAMTLLQP